MKRFSELVLLFKLVGRKLDYLFELFIKVGKVIKAAFKTNGAYAYIAFH